MRNLALKINRKFFLPQVIGVMSLKFILLESLFQFNLSANYLIIHMKTLMFLLILFSKSFGQKVHHLDKNRGLLHRSTQPKEKGYLWQIKDVDDESAPMIMQRTEWDFQRHLMSPYPSIEEKVMDVASGRQEEPSSNRTQHNWRSFFITIKDPSS